MDPSDSKVLVKYQNRLRDILNYRAKKVVKLLSFSQNLRAFWVQAKNWTHFTRRYWSNPRKRESLQLKKLFFFS